jgi:phospholipid transport system substrate-binding protein
MKGCMRACTAALLGCLVLAQAFAGEQPVDVLRANVARGLAVLNDPAYEAPAQRSAQRERLCEIAQEMFDPRLFSKLALGAAWKRFNATEQNEFVATFGAYLCRYYLSRLQAYYTDETVEFVHQEFKSAALATVKVEVLWQEQRVPVTIRMALREGRWKAYDLVFMGVSAVLVYRTQFEDALRESTPAALIQSLRDRGGVDG